MIDAILNSLLAINLDVNIWTARRKLSVADFGGAQLPPDDLASLGSKRVCDPEELKIFGTLKARAVSLLDRNGVRFLGGWGIPEDRAQAIVEELERLRDEFAAAKQDFLARYDQAVQEWIVRHAGWEQIILSSTVGVDYVRSRLGFRWQVYRIVPPTGDPAMVGTVGVGLADEVHGLGLTLFEEVAKAATEAWHKCFAGKSEVTRKAVSPLRTIQRKLAGLTFIEPRVAPVADLLETAFASLPRRGKIQGASLLMLQGLVALLRDPAALTEHGQMLIEGRAPGALLDDLLRQPPLVSLKDDLVDIGPEFEADLGSTPVDLNPQPVLLSHGLW